MIATLKEGDWVEETYLVVAKQVLTAKNGVTYLSLKLADKTGEIDGKMWDNAEDASGKFAREDFIRIKGVVSNYQGALQVKMKSLERIDDASVDISSFVQSSPRDPGEMENELRSMASGIANDPLRRLMEAFLNDASFMEGLKRAPAAKTMHHNYVGGLLEHVLELIALCRTVAGHFPGIDADLLAVGAFLHDIGKIREMSVRKSIEYTTEGRLIGHISLGYEMLTDKIIGLPDFPPETTMLLKHIMLSHHGEYEFGSPKRPKIREALIIHYLDDLSAKLNNYQITMAKESVGEGEWSAFNKMHDRYLYRPASPPAAAAPHTAEAPARGGHSGDGGKQQRRDKAPKDGKKEESGKLPLDI